MEQAGRDRQIILTDVVVIGIYLPVVSAFFTLGTGLIYGILGSLRK